MADAIMRIKGCGPVSRTTREEFAKAVQDIMRQSRVYLESGGIWFEDQFVPWNPIYTDDAFRLKVLEIIEQAGPLGIRNREIQQKLGIRACRKKVNHVVRKWVRRGLVLKEGERSTTIYRHASFNSVRDPRLDEWLGVPK